ncbi:MAG: indolepyruvate ferredoxin oxidoreductase subunit alpha [Candidatus Altiarchaeales archaeon]|nr:MAG: indolepyruvate ferredoxin oxidoreductase subunit alpha [Candidatus Altiarchaeales archaeon]
MKKLLLGNEALAQGAYEAGLKVACSYPGTPATEILEYLARFPDVDCQWSTNEKVAFEVALAGAIAGARSLFAAKHVGLNVASDPLMTSAYLGVNAGFLIVSCDDPGLHSSQNEQDNRFYALFAKIPLLEPSSPKEAKDFAKEAFKISEKFDIPVMIRMTTRVSHSKEVIAIDKRKIVKEKNFKPDFEKYVMIPRNAMKRHEVLESKLRKLKAFSEKTKLNRIELNERSLGFITSGVSYLYAKEMFPEASFLKLGLSFPLPEKKIREFSSEVEKLIVLEELEPFLELQIRALGIEVEGKHPSFRVGELKPEYIKLILAGKPKPKLEKKARKPSLCPGCPYRPVFWILKKLNLLVAGDIGCYTLASLPRLSSLHTCLCMGASISFHEGFRRVLKGKDVVAVIGDSTFIHSGIPALINSVYNRARGLIIILDNETTAMTGFQDHPGTGKTIKAEPTRKLQLEEICRACGVKFIDVLDPYRDLKKLEELIKLRLRQDELSVIIVRRKCQLLSRKSKPKPLYLKENCKKCYLCLEIDCPALRKDANGFIEIDESLCVGCYLCVEVCKFNALIKNEEQSC